MVSPHSPGPRVDRTVVSSFDAAMEYLGDREECFFIPNKGKRARAYGGGLVWHPPVDAAELSVPEHVGVRYHDTEVITLYANGDIAFDSGGWRTRSTANWMNAVIGYRVEFPSAWRGRDATNPDVIFSKTGKGYLFFDGIAFSKRGKCLSPYAVPLAQRQAEIERERDRRKRVFTNARSMSYKAIRRLRRGMTIPDCEMCESFLPPGEYRFVDADLSPSDAQAHLLGHLNRRTVSAGLIRTAVIGWMRERHADPSNWRYWLNLHVNRRGNIAIGGSGLPRMVEPHIRRAVYRFTVDAVMTGVNPHALPNKEAG